MSKKTVGLLGLVTIGGMMLTLVVPLLASAQIIPLEPEEREPPEIPPLQILPTIINWAFGILLVFVVLMIIIAGYIFVTAGGSPERLTTARKWLMYALIGLAIAVLARGLMALVLQILGYTP